MNHAIFKCGWTLVTCFIKLIHFINEIVISKNISKQALWIPNTWGVERWRKRFNVTSIRRKKVSSPIGGFNKADKTSQNVYLHRRLYQWIFCVCFFFPRVRWVAKSDHLITVSIFLHILLVIFDVWYLLKLDRIISIVQIIY